MVRSRVVAVPGPVAMAPRAAHAETFSISFRCCFGSSGIALSGAPDGTTITS